MDFITRLPDVFLSGGAILGQPLSGSQVEILVDNLHVMKLLQNRGTESALGMTGIQSCKSRRPLAVKGDRLSRDMASLYKENTWLERP